MSSPFPASSGPRFLLSTWQFLGENGYRFHMAGPPRTGQFTVDHGKSQQNGFWGCPYFRKSPHLFLPVSDENSPSLGPTPRKQHGRHLPKVPKSLLFQVLPWRAQLPQLTHLDFSLPSWRSFNTSSTQKAASLIHVFVVSCCIVGRFPVVCKSPCPPRTRTSLQPFAAAEVSTAMALKREDRLPGPGDATPEDQASKMCCSYLQLLQGQ